MRDRFCAVAFAASLATAPALANETPLYQPAPAWVVPAALPDLTKVDANAAPLLLFDLQERVEGAKLSTYVDTATKIGSAEMLAQLATLSRPWAPDKGDLIVHEVSVMRGGQRIDLLAKGQKFTVLRREQALERRELTGILTATLALEGLQVGDVLRFRMTTTSKDDALGGRVQGIAPLFAAPLRVGTANVRLSWPSASPPHMKVLATGATPVTTKKGAFTEVTLPLPIVKQPEMPDDAPLRYRHPPLLEVSSFSDWTDVSSVMAPLFSTDGAIAAGSPLAAEVTAIMKADQTQIGRAERALELVQDKIRYLALGMDGGNYVPQKAARTWEVRYGDCKAKTLLLLALLHAMNIEAEPVLANVGLGDFVVDRLPSAAAFNHVLVHATVDGQPLWLDGTASGSRLADIHDTPAFRSVLPLRPAGAGLMPIVTHADARPMIDLFVDADESATLDLPSVFDATAVVRGGAASQMILAKAQLDVKQQREAASQFFTNFLGEMQVSSASITPDTTTGEVTLKARGVIATPWGYDNRQRKRLVERALDGIAFSPDRGRPTWTAIPVAGSDPVGMRYRLRLRLPDDGKGYSVEGEPGLKTHAAGYDMNRTLQVDGAIVVAEERLDLTGEEIPAAQIPAERDKLETIKARAPRIVAPENAKGRWDLAGHDPAGATQMKAIDAVYTQAIANDPDEASGYTSRASYRWGIGDYRGSIADTTKAIAIAPTVDMYLERAAHEHSLGDSAAALADADAARKLDPSSAGAIGSIARLHAERGDLAGGVALLDERIALGGTTRAAYTADKADLIGHFGDPAVAIKLYDQLLLDKPGSPGLLNGRCWVKGTRSVMLDTAVKDCTSAIEVSTFTAPVLDSRAMVWYRLNRYDDALRDLDAVIATAPNLAASQFMRGVVLTRLGRKAEAAKNLAIARMIDPGVDATYARYGIKA